MNPRTIRVLRPTRPDAFPAVELVAAAPCLVEGDDEVLAAAAPGAAGARTWAEGLAAELPGSAWSIRALEANETGWTHHFRLQTETGYRDFVVVARGLPADEAEAAAHGLEEVRLDAVLATAPPDAAVN